MTTHCVGEAYAQLHAEKAHVIVSSFGKLDLSLPIDRSLDHELDIMGFENLEIGNWQEDLGSLDDRADAGIAGNEVIEFLN